jgi:RNA polymerase I-specific transcription initiation factor RRN6
MDDGQHAVQPAARAKPRRVPTDGIIGRLTYTPAQGDECIGQIRRNRASDESEYLNLDVLILLSKLCTDGTSPSVQASSTFHPMVCSG